METKLNVLYLNGESIPTIDMCPVEDDERMYHESDFDHFQYVFTKDNMATYHQQFDNFLHWIWNEYDNDPEKYESSEYKTKICDKVFTTINAKIFGVLNTDDNHALIVNILSKVVNDTFPDVNMFEYIASKRDALCDRQTKFTADDAIVWYTIDTPSISKDALFANKHLPMPYIKLDGANVPIGFDHLQDFYLALFRYTIKWYNHLYATKNESAWMNVNENDYIFAIKSHAAANDNFRYLNPDDDTNEIITMKNFHQIKDFNLNDDEFIVLNIATENGQFHDKVMQPFCFAYLAKREDGYWISSQRGFDRWRLIHNEYENTDTWMKRWVNTLAARNKNEEAALTELWRDVMQCNAVVFPTDDRISITIRLRIIHWTQYSNRISLMLDLGDRIMSVDSDNDIAYLSITNINTLWKIWRVLEHTLDLWVDFGSDSIKWSLISNIYHNEYRMYSERPHIIKVPARMNLEFSDDDFVFAIVPRDGMSWYADKIKYTYTPQSINGIIMRKSYL